MNFDVILQQIWEVFISVGFFWAFGGGFCWYFFQAENLFGGRNYFLVGGTAENMRKKGTGLDSCCAAPIQ